MMWMDYNIMQAGSNFKIEGDWPTEVMDKGLYKPGDVFVVDANGWLRKIDEVHALLLKHESNVRQQSQQQDQNT